MWMYESLAPFCMGDETAWRWRIIKQKSFSSSVEKLFFSPMQERERERETHLSFYCQRPRVLPVSTIRFWMESKIDVRPRQGYTVKSYGLLHPNGVDICNYITGELHHILHIATTPDAGWLKVFRKTLFTIFLLFLSPLFFFSFVPSSKPSKTRCAHDGARKWWQTCAITINIAPFPLSPLRTQTRSPGVCLHQSRYRTMEQIPPPP